MQQLRKLIKLLDLEEMRTLQKWLSTEIEQGLEAQEIELLKEEVETNGHAVSTECYSLEDCKVVSINAEVLLVERVSSIEVYNQTKGPWERLLQNFPFHEYLPSIIVRTEWQRVRNVLQATGNIQLYIYSSLPNK